VRASQHYVSLTKALEQALPPECLEDPFPNFGHVCREWNVETD